MRSYGSAESAFEQRSAHRHRFVPSNVYVFGESDDAERCAPNDRWKSARRRPYPLDIHLIYAGIDDFSPHVRKTR